MSVPDDLHEEQHEAEHEVGEELWLISYSDMMTLLFGFFVMMYALSKSTAARQEEVKQAVSRSLAGNYVPQDSELAKDIKELAKKAQEADLLGQIEVSEPKDGLEITFRSNILFSSGSANLKKEITHVMQQLVKIILKSVNDAEIMIAGHTDDVSINTDKFPSNWELSAARAATVVKEFERNGYRSDLLVAIGYGSSRPAFPNRSKTGAPLPNNQEKNRRVVIKVVSPGVVKQPSPVGAKAPGLNPATLGGAPGVTAVAAGTSATTTSPNPPNAPNTATTIPAAPVTAASSTTVAPQGATPTSSGASETGVKQ